MWPIRSGGVHRADRQEGDKPAISRPRQHGAVDDQRVGRIVRALRRRLSWRQIDLARTARCSQAMVSLIERGHLQRVSLPIVRRVVAALDASLVIEVRWRAGALDRLLDEGHARLAASVANHLVRAGWEVHVEVTYSHFGERGSFDILAYWPQMQLVLVIELKTDLASAEGTLRKLDEKVRLASIVGRERFGWPIREVARLLVMPETSTLRRRVVRHDGLFDRVLPARGASVRRWVASPDGPMSGLWFLSLNGASVGIQGRGGRERVRRPKLPPVTDHNAA